MPPAADTVLFLPDLGAGPDSWAAQLRALPEWMTGLAPEIPGLDRAGTPGAFTFPGAAAGLRDLLDERRIERVHVCGLSLGAMTATQLALDFPERVASLVLSGSQVAPHPALMTVQRAVIRLLPESTAAGMGLTKAQWLGALRVVADADFRPGLASIQAPVLVLCGARDVANLPAARELAATLPDAELQIVPRAGHTWNVELPDLFSRTVATFWARLAARA
ncbi:alpha/beta fold hydrolase [Promicromonospora citrea]|nr:alpha/beta fold hydrolase [Promicromonospora citrea]NNH54158.1 alpha/beta fold hydrolase [Promicromonospora citrea]